MFTVGDDVYSWSGTLREICGYVVAWGVDSPSVGGVAGARVEYVVDDGVTPLVCDGSMFLLFPVVFMGL